MPGVDLLPSGAWRVRVMVRGRRITEVCPTREAAIDLRRALLQEAADGPAAPAKAPAVETLATWGEAWMNRREKAGAVRWSKVDRNRWRTHIAGSPLAALALVEVRPKDVRAWLEGMMGKRKPNGRPLSRQTITHAFNLVRKALADAAADERIGANPAAGVAVPKRAEKRDADPWTYLSAEEVAAVESCETMPEVARLLFTVAIRTGLRAGELWALRWGAVALEGPAPVVVVRASHKGAPKNGKVQRVPLLPAARVAFERLRELADDTAPDALVFPTSTGVQRSRGDDARWLPESGGKGKPLRWHGYRAMAGINRDVRFHDLRHTFASHLVMGTWTAAPLPLAEVRALMRHGSVAMTERYAHLAPEHLHARIAAAPSPRPAEAVAAPHTTDVRTSAEEPAPAPPEALRVVTNRRDQIALPDVVTPSHRFARNPLFSRAPPAGIGPATFGLGSRGETAGIPEDSAGRDQPVTNEAGPLRALALELLRAVDEGLPAAGVARELAVDVLRRSVPDTSAWTLAISALEGGPLRVRRAVELAALLLEEAAAIDAATERTAAGE